jgi:hypothetical protein
MPKPKEKATAPRPTPRTAAPRPASHWPSATDESKRLGIAKQSLLYWIRTGRVEGRRDDHIVCVNPESLQEFLAARARCGMGFFPHNKAKGVE